MHQHSTHQWMNNTPRRASLTSGGFPAASETAVAVRTLGAELRQLEALSHAAAAAATTGDLTVADGTEAGAPARQQLALELQIARREVELLQDHLHIAHKRSESLQSTLEQRELELQRSQAQTVEVMRTSGALLGSLAGRSPAVLTEV